LTANEKVDMMDHKIVSATKMISYWNVAWKTAAQLYSNYKSESCSVWGTARFNPI